MHFYPHHIGDFNNATRHLTRVERSIYRDLIDHYYDTEQPLPNDIKFLSRKIIARSDEELEALTAVLDEFFHLDEDQSAFTHKKCDQVLEDYWAECEKLDEKRQADRERKQASREKRVGLFAKAKELGIQTDIKMSNAEIAGLIKEVTKDKSIVTSDKKEVTKDKTENSNGVTSPVTLNQEPETKNQKPETNSYKYDLSSWPQLPDLDLYNDWLKAKRKAKGTVSQRALNTIGKNLTELFARGFSVNFCLEKAESNSWKGIEVHYFDRFTPDMKTATQGSSSEQQSILEFVDDQQQNDPNVLEGEFYHAR